MGTRVEPRVVTQEHTVSEKEICKDSWSDATLTKDRGEKGTLEFKDGNISTFVCSTQSNSTDGSLGVEKAELSIREYFSAENQYFNESPLERFGEILSSNTDIKNVSPKLSRYIFKQEHAWNEANKSGENVNQGPVQANSTLDHSARSYFGAYEGGSGEFKPEGFADNSPLEGLAEESPLERLQAFVEEDSGLNNMTSGLWNYVIGQQRAWDQVTTVKAWQEGGAS